MLRNNTNIDITNIPKRAMRELAIRYLEYLWLPMIILFHLSCKKVILLIRTPFERNFWVWGYWLEQVTIRLHLTPALQYCLLYS